MKSVTWTAGVSAQTRLDCVVAGSADTTGVEGSCNAGDKMTPVPVPAAGFLLAGGLGVLAALRRRKSKTV